jgi:hypothetical protein
VMQGADGHAGHRRQLPNLPASFVHGDHPQATLAPHLGSGASPAPMPQTILLTRVEGVAADHRTGQHGQPREAFRGTLIGDPQPPPSAKPRAGPLDRPAVAAKPIRRLDHPAGEPGADATPAQLRPAAAMSEALSPCTLPGRRRRRPLGIRIAGMSSSTASNMVASLALAALRTPDSGRPSASPARCSLDPCLPRSTGFAPVRSPL